MKQNLTRLIKIGIIGASTGAAFNFLYNVVKYAEQQDFFEEIERSKGKEAAAEYAEHVRQFNNKWYRKMLGWFNWGKRKATRDYLEDVNNS